MDSRLVLNVAEDDADDLRLDELARQLRDALLQTDVDSVEPCSAGPAPPGAKAGIGVVAGALLAHLGALPLRQLVDIVLQWLKSARSQRSVRLEIGGDVLVLRGVNDETQQRLVDEWLLRHPVDAARVT